MDEWSAMNFIISGDTHGALNLAKIVRFFDEHEGEYNEEVEGQYFCLFDEMVVINTAKNN